MLGVILVGQEFGQSEKFLCAPGFDFVLPSPSKSFKGPKNLDTPACCSMGS